MKKISLLGSTGSIGTQACEVIRTHSDKFALSSIAVNTNISTAENQIREFKPQAVAVFDLKSANDLKIKIADTNTKVLCGMDGLCEISSSDNTDVLLNSVTGMIGLEPTLTAIEAKKDIALANKETLVTGGD
ncbi:MAG: 1-deoxy-D-xylulose-5-phosphate reductoisomerase, partial [Clostridia bacterium]